MNRLKTIQFREKTIEGLLFVSSLISVFTTAAIILVLAVEAIGFFLEVPIGKFLFDTQWTPLFSDKHFGILPLLSGTFLTSLIAMVVALPIGLISAIYLSEYASPKFRNIAKPVIELLAAVPTVVYGYFALLFITPLLKKFIPDISTFNSLSAGLAMGIMILPLISTLCEDALRSVPNAYREGGYALGATRVQVALTVILPSAFSGITAAFILGISRAIGETMIVAIAAGQQPTLTLNPLVPLETITAYIVQVSLGDVPHGTLEYKTLYVCGATLFVFNMVLNIISLKMRESFKKKYTPE